MNLAQLAVVVTLATIPPVHAIGWVAIRVWRRMATVPRDRGDANAIFLASVAPALLGVGAALLVTLPAFLWFEPPGRRELPGMLLAASAAVGAAYVLTAVGRALSAARLSRRCLNAWMAGASPLSTGEWGLPAYAIEANYPVVAVAGVIRPRLLIDRRVLASCCDEELRAIAGHELAHVENRDNARRLLLAACVGSRSAHARRWRHAAEVAADRRAAADPYRAAVLAGALVKIARLAALAPAPPIPFAAIHRDGSLEARVEGLLSASPHPAERGWPAPLVVAATVFSIAMAAHGLQILAAVHSGIEQLVRPH